MLYTQQTQQEVLRRFKSLKVPKRITARCAADLLKWTEKSGTEWTVKRLKALKTDFIRSTGGLTKSSDWIKYSGSSPKGGFGELFRWGHQDAKRIVKALNALMVYTQFVSPKATSKQLDKFYGSLASAPSDESAIAKYASLCVPVARKLSVGSKRIRTVTDYVPRDSRRCPTSDGGSIPESNWIETVDVIWNTSLGRLLYQRYSSLREVVKPLDRILVSKLSRLPDFIFERESIRYNGFAGKIGHIQEPGFKLRAVANPFRVYQLALSRFGDQLYELVDSRVCDCTHDQNQGIDWAQQKLKSGHEMFAVDLSDATNQFPLALQLKIVEQIAGVKVEDINLFRDLSTANWLSPTHGLVKWTKGQPLGLYPSFAVFTLAHGVLLEALAVSCGLSETDSFRVLGDDVVISERKLYLLYREALKALDIGVSEDKTISSRFVTEFGGRVIYPDQVITTSKWRMSSDRNFLDLIRNTGPGYIQYLRPRQRIVAAYAVTLPEPLGLNINPYGIPLDDRIALEQAVTCSSDRSNRFPPFAKSSWLTTLMNSTWATSYFGPRRTFPIQEGVLTSGRPDQFASEEVLSRICHSTGSPFDPNAQFRELSEPGPDVFERISKIAKDLKLNHFKTSGDPRGATTLELWEKRYLKRISSGPKRTRTGSNSRTE